MLGKVRQIFLWNIGRWSYDIPYEGVNWLALTPDSEGKRPTGKQRPPAPSCLFNEMPRNSHAVFGSHCSV